MKIALVELKPNEAVDIYEMVMEIGKGENGFVNSLFADTLEKFQEAIFRNYEISKAIDLPDGYVPQTLYWLYIDDRPVGYGKLRHYLNDSLRVHGGHIGYVIRPTERGNGYGKIILEELLKRARDKSIHEVLLTCDETNGASRTVIESNNGKLTEFKNGECKYWIRT